MNDFLVYLNLLIGDIILYNLAIAYIGVLIPFKKTILPVIIVSLITYLFRIVLLVPGSLSVLIWAIAILLLLYFLNKVPFLLSFFGALLSVITIGCGSIMISLPLYVIFKFKDSFEPGSFSWFLISYTDFIVPGLMLFILKYKKISILKYLN